MTCEAELHGSVTRMPSSILSDIGSHRLLDPARLRPPGQRATGTQWPAAAPAGTGTFLSLIVALSCLGLLSLGQTECLLAPAGIQTRPCCDSDVEAKKTRRS